LLNGQNNGFLEHDFNLILGIEFIQPPNSICDTSIAHNDHYLRDLLCDYLIIRFTCIELRLCHVLLIGQVSTLAL